MNGSFCYVPPFFSERPFREICIRISETRKLESASMQAFGCFCKLRVFPFSGVLDRTALLFLGEYYIGPLIFGDSDMLYTLPNQHGSGDGPLQDYHVLYHLESTL